VAGGAQGWGVRGIRERCRDLRATLADAPDLCSPEELTAYWPGGEENLLPSPGCWIYCFQQYGAFLRRGETKESDDDGAAAQQAALDAFREKPVAVQLVQRAEDGTPQWISVYPKSFDTLSLIDELDGNRRWLVDRYERLGRRWSADDELCRQEILREDTELALTICWILTTPGCSAPFDPAAVPADIPDDVRRLDSPDLINILRAHREVNQQRIDVIATWIRSLGAGGTSGKALSWATLATGAAKSQGQLVEHLLRNRSMGAWLAQAAVTWSEERQAAEAAARAPDDRPTLREQML